MNEKEILQVESYLSKAIQEKNILILDQVIHDHMLFNGPFGNVLTKSMYIGSCIKEEIQIERLEISDRKISIFTDTAIVSFNVDLQGHHMKKPVKNKFRVLSIWQDSGLNEYKMIGGSCIPLLP